MQMMKMIIMKMKSIYIIEISLVNRVRCNTHVLIFMLAITNTSKLPLDRNFGGQEVVKTEKVIKTRFCTIFNRLKGFIN